MGHPSVEDHNRPWALGAGPLPANRIDGLRMSASLAFLAAARGRPNLTIRPGTLVDTVLFDAGRAVGIRLAETGETIRSGAVVLAAGAYQSPAILLRSGVGPAHALADSGIPVLIDLPGVGSNLIDHVWTSVDVPAWPDPPEAPLGQTVITFRSAVQSEDRMAGVPDLQLVPCSAIRVPQAESPTGAVLFVGAALLKPRARGRVWLRSPDPAVAPRIDPGHLRHPDDMARAIEGVVAARTLLRTAPLSGLVAGPEMKPAPGIADDDGAGLAAGIRATFGTYHHPVGTCRMGPDPDSGAVVDPRGRVHGAEGLWVADASVMPDVPSANTNLPTIMVAERIAGWLREVL
jgi:choline dehydrogenase